MAKNEKNVVKQEVPEENTESNIFTYVGVGADSPFRIKFMGRQEFVRGKPQEVTDPELLTKIVGNPSFVRGEIDREEIDSRDEEERSREENIRVKDMRINKAYTEKFRSLQKGDE